MKFYSLLLLFLLLWGITANAQSWRGPDTAGRQVQIPPAGQVSILLFFQPQQTHSQREIADLQNILANPQRRNIQLIGIISGPDSPQQAARMDPKLWHAPLLLDQQYEGSGRFAIAAWPTAVVVDPQGKIVGRIPGSPINFTVRLAAYLDFATGQITADQLEKQLADCSVIQDSADQKALRHLLLTEQLFASDRLADARKQLQAAQDLSPVADAVRLRLARAQLLLGEANLADDLLSTLEAKASPATLPAGDGTAAAQLLHLRGWAALSLGRWGEAEKLLLKARQQGAAPAEVSYHLGLVYLHQGQHQQAAEAFRQACDAVSKSFAALP